MKERLKRMIAGCLVLTITASILPTLPAKAEEMKWYERNQFFTFTK